MIDGSLKIDEAALANASQGIAGAGRVLRLAATDVNHKWTQDLKTVVAQKLLAFLKKEAEDVAIEQAKYFYNSDEGMQGYTADQLDLDDDQLGIKHKPIKDMNAQELERYTRFYFWHQSQKERIASQGARYDVTVPPVARVKYTLPISALPDGMQHQMYPNEDELLAAEKRGDTTVVLKYLGRGNYRGFGGMMVGDWQNPATWYPRDGKPSDEEIAQTQAFGPQYKGWLEVLNGQATGTRGQAHEIRIRSNDPVFMNNELTKITGEAVDRKLALLQKMHRTETLQQLKIALVKMGAS